jgi:methylated-DNA-[protein]-cysteine S-methyltransferase
MKPEPLWTQLLETPLGPMGVVLDANGRLERLAFLQRSRITLDHLSDTSRPAGFKFLQRQLEAYFHGTCQTFNIPLALHGSPLHLRVWDELQSIPYGRTITYLELATRLGDARLTRAVGQALTLNPVVLVVPCHRVVGSDGGLTGYSGGVDRKHALLGLERGEQLLGCLLSETD